MTYKTWMILLLGSLGTLIVLGAFAAILESRYPEAPKGMELGLGIPMILLVIVLVVSIPPVVVPAFISAQIKIGNGSHPLLLLLGSDPARAVRLVWWVWGIGLAMALPWAIWDWTHPPPLPPPGS